MLFVPHQYQKQAARFAFDRPGCGLFLDPGLGKTAISLTVIRGLIAAGLVKRVLVIAPLRVCYSVWPKERSRWDQFKKLRCSIVHGSVSRRLKALHADSDIYLINPEGVDWLSKLEGQEFDLLIVDESTKFKNPSSKRFKALQKILPAIPRKMILSGTPSPNTLIDLWSQIFILDSGQRLEKRITHFHERYFYPGGYENREWFPKPGTKEAIESAIGDIVLRLDCRDLLDMPELIFNDIWVDLPGDVMTAYKRLERELFFSIESQAIDETAMSSSAKYLMCRQVANGGIYYYSPNGGFEGSFVRRFGTPHNEKIEAIADLHEELNGKPLMVIFHFRHELQRLLERFGKKTPFIAGGVHPKTVDSICDRWNEGTIPLLLCQPQSMSHGLNLQSGGNDICWFGMTDDLEQYLQTNARLWRQGVVGGVRIHRVLAKNTVDIAIRNRIDRKESLQQSLLDALKGAGTDVAFTS